jgi:hypothetical protein
MQKMQKPPRRRGTASDAGFRAAVNVLVHRYGSVVEASETSEVRQVGSAYFYVLEPGIAVSDPYPDLPSLFATEGSTLVSGPAGRVLEWQGWVLSEDRHGTQAGPFPGFDEWVWAAGETVWRSASPSPTGQGAWHRFVHAWKGFHFVTVDPFPTGPKAYPSLESALRALPSSLLGGTSFHEA